MKKSIRSPVKILALFSGAVLIVLLIFLFWLYTGNLSQAKVRLFNRLPLPFALVNGRAILMKDYVLNYNLTKQILSQNQKNPSDAQIKQQTQNQLIYNAKVGNLASNLGVFPDQTQIDDEYDYQSSQGGPNFQATAAGYGLSASQIKSLIVVPELAEVNLRIWFNSQAQLNPAAYAAANSLADQIKNGADMGTLAAAQSDDTADKTFSGDLGFVEITSVLPELRDPIENMKIGDVKTISSRFGLHIIRLEGKDSGNRLHLRQIFINTPDFNGWLDNYLKNFSVILF